MKVIQLSDLHLTAPGGELFGSSPLARLELALARIGAEHGDADFCLLTGDLADAGGDAAYAALAARNAAENGIPLQVETGDLADMPRAFRHDFDHVIANPPYYPRGGTPSPIAARATALQIETPLAAWVQAATRRLAPGGWLTLICGADGLPEVLAAMGTKLGSASVLPLTPRAGKPALRIILRARKTGRGAFRLLAPFVIHDGPAHDGDRESYTARANDVLRNGADLSAEFS